MAALVGRTVKLSRSGRQMKGCCPFHGEKTPSFYVYEDGFHCFGCGAHGDAIGFLMKTSSAGFVEAVQSLAAEAGLDLPKPSPDAEAVERKRLDLHGVLDAAQQYFRNALMAPGGAAALAYLRGRGLSDATIARFGLGWAGEGRGALASALAAQNIGQAQLLEAGLLRLGESGEVRGELFFNRVMFPIRDRTGRMISFGGRTLGDGQPKYVNGPETALFSKRRTLYALDLARLASRKTSTLVVVEGYMDVIALHQAGYEATVAPLGTALTAEQLTELWRLGLPPILCFDGDDAGARATERAALTALPLLAPDRTISFASLPAGYDPDTLTRRAPEAFAAILKASRPLATAIYQCFRTSTGDKSPHQRGTLLHRLDDAARLIPDKILANEYRQAFRSLFFARPTDNRRKRSTYSESQTSYWGSVRQDLSEGQGVAISDKTRIKILAAILLIHPNLLPDVEEAYGSLNLPSTFVPLRDAILTFSHEDVLDSRTLLNHLDALGLSAAVARVLEELPSCGRPDAQPAEAEAGWWHFYGLMHREELERAKKAAERHFSENGADPAAFARHNALSIAWFRLSQGKQTDTDQEAEAEAFDL